MGMLLTQAGQNALHALIAADQPLVITEMSFGTADRNPTGGETELVAEVIRKPVVNKEVADGKVRFDAILERDEGPWTIYEVGLHDDAGTLIAIGRAPGLTKLVGADDEMHSLDISVSLLTSTLQNLVVEIDPQFALVPQSRQINTGAGMKGGGALSSDRDLEVDFATATEAADVTNEVKVLSPATAQSAIARALPPGAMMDFAMLEPPSQWMIMDGALALRAEFPELFAVIGTQFGAGDGVTTFGIPDGRAVVRRGLDLGRGLDVGRILGSYQDDAIREISGDLKLMGTNGSNQVVRQAYGAFNRSGDYADGWRQLETVSGNYVQDVSFRASRVVPTASENRMRNIAVLPCIKYI